MSKEITCTLTNEELINRAHLLVAQLIASNGKDWTLRVPAEPNRCPDLIFTELCERLAASSVGGMNWVKALKQLPIIPEGEQKTEDLYLDVDGDKEIGRFWKIGEDEYFMTKSLRLLRPHSYYMVKWYDPSPTPILQNQHDDDLAIEALDFYYRHVCWKLGSSDLGDIERKNYEVIAQKLKIRIQ